MTTAELVDRHLEQCKDLYASALALKERFPHDETVAAAVDAFLADAFADQ